MKCHGCKEPIQTEWHRGQLSFCSEKCRQTSLNEGEPCDNWFDDGGGELVYVAAKPKEPQGEA